MQRISLWLEDEDIEKLKKKQLEFKEKYFSEVIRKIIKIYLE